MAKGEELSQAEAFTMVLAMRSGTGRSAGTASSELSRTNMSSTPMPISTKGRTLMTGFTSLKSDEMPYEIAIAKPQLTSPAVATFALLATAVQA